MSVLGQAFYVVDQAVFFASIAIGGFVGMYFAYFAPRASNQEADYLFGERKMKTVPIALSLAASALSGLAMVGLPAEVYIYGMQYAYSTLFLWVVTIFYNAQFLPVFHGLQGLSLNEYFEKRFDKRLRLLVAVLFFFSSICVLPISMYVPSLAYEQITGFNKYWVTVCVSIVCIFYTSIGGLKAVVWTDAIQLVSMLSCVFVIIVKGTYDVGPSALWERTVAAQRLELPYVDFDPTVRQTIFSVLMGGFCVKLRHIFLSQGQVQRHQSVPTIGHAKRAVWLMTGIQTFIHMSCFYMGLLAFAVYFNCDPITSKIVSTKDQILPLYVMQKFSDYPGLTGIFLSGIFSASLSTVSTILNTLSGVFVEDWIRGFTRWNPSAREATWIMRIFVLVVGLIILSLVFVVAQLGTIFQAAVSIDAIFSGPLVTVFITALFLPWVSSLGALVGAAAAIASSAPLVIGTQYSIAKGLLHFPTKPFVTDGCPEMFNVSTDFVKNLQASAPAIPYGPTRGDVWYPFRISHYYFLPISITCGLTAAVLVTIFFSRTDLQKLDRRLVAPISLRWLPKSTEQARPRRKDQIATDGEETHRMLPIDLNFYGHQ